MANKSNWKGTEKLAARLFPGGRRRTRVGGGSYAILADDVIWGLECDAENGRIRKLPIIDGRAIYIDCKKKSVSGLVSEFKSILSKYRTSVRDRLILITHRKNEKQMLVTVDQDFFHELIRSWCRERDLFMQEIDSEKKEETDK